jgi:hypothetical protein
MGGPHSHRLYMPYEFCLLPLHLAPRRGFHLRVTERERVPQIVDNCGSDQNFCYLDNTKRVDECCPSDDDTS